MKAVGRSPHLPARPRSSHQGPRTRAEDTRNHQGTPANPPHHPRWQQQQHRSGKAVTGGQQLPATPPPCQPGNAPQANNNRGHPHTSRTLPHHQDTGPGQARTPPTSREQRRGRAAGPRDRAAKLGLGIEEPQRAGTPPAPSSGSPPLNYPPTPTSQERTHPTQHPTGTGPPARRVPPTHLLIPTTPKPRSKSPPPPTGFPTPTTGTSTPSRQDPHHGTHTARPSPERHERHQPRSTN